MKLAGVLKGITELIVQSCDPHKVVLFGSYAKGQENVESDLDILVIGDFKESCFLRGRELREALHRYPIGIDLHVVTPDEIAHETQQPFGFLSSILTSGVCLYIKNKP